MNLLLSKMKKINKYHIGTSITILAVAIAGCVSQKDKTSTEVLGTYNSKQVKFSDLSIAEKTELVNAQKKVYETAQAILEKYYLDSWFADYQAKNKIASLDLAKKDFYSKNANISDEVVQNFIKENAANPQMQQIPEKERAGLVKQYLTRMEQSKAEQGILLKAQEEGKINVVGIEKPKDIQVTFNNEGYKYDSSLKDPKVTIVEFADYQCPYCVQAHETIEKVLAAYKGKVQYVFKDFPLTQIHPEAMPAAIAAKCASNQNKYWEMHKLLFGRAPMDKLSGDMYYKYATDLKLNMNDFKSCMEDKDKTLSKSVMAQLEEGNSIGVSGTPSIFINGQKYEGNLSFEGIKKEIDEKLALK
jgi:protein-disulfide isomerase